MSDFEPYIWNGWVEVKREDPPPFTTVLLGEEGSPKSFLGCWNPEKKAFCQAEYKYLPLRDVEITHWSFYPTPPYKKKEA